MSQLGLVEPIDGFGQCVVVTVAPAAHRGLYARLIQAFGIADGSVTAPIGMVRQGISRRLALVQGLLQRIQHEVRLHAATDPPAHDTPGVHVHHEGHIEPALPGGDVGEVRHPQLVGAAGMEVPVDVVQRARCRCVWRGGAQRLATTYPLQAHGTHEPLNGTTCHQDALAVHLQPDLVGSVDLPVGVPHALDVSLQPLVTQGACTAQLRVALPGGMAPVARRGHLQYTTDGLDPVIVTVAVDVGLHDLSRRSSSACAKNALAVLRMSLARRSSLTSRSSSLMRWASELVVPAR